MSRKLIQFNSGEHVIGDKNIVESLVSDDDLVFNESYIVVGPSLEGNNIHATYDLTVIGDIHTQKISVNGDLLVQGDIEADELVCHGTFICTGDVRVIDLTLESYSVAGSIVSKVLRSSGDLFLQTTVDTDEEFESDGLVVAGEGIMGDGSFKAKIAIANEYFEFSGTSKSNVFEICEMTFSEASTERSDTNNNQSHESDVSIAVECFEKALNNSLITWNELEEDEFIEKIREITIKTQDLHMADRILDRVITLSYEREISNFCDLLFLVCAKNVFPDGLSEYETIAPVLTEMYEEALYNVDSMEYKAANIEEFAISLYSLHCYYDQLPISFKEGADKVFSSIGIKYATVEHVWRKING